MNAGRAVLSRTRSQRCQEEEPAVAD